MEGITLSRFRQIHHEMFPGVSEYYTPFIAPDSNGGFRAKFLRELTADFGQVPVVPQLLVNNAEAFCLTADRLFNLGFREINLNTGCPSGTVFSKHKGAGMLRDPASLDTLLDCIMDHAASKGYRISVKTRMGVHSNDEFPGILEIYEKYPVKKLIVHARCRDEFYQGRADLAGFAETVSDCRVPLVYNGDIASEKDLEALRMAAPQVPSVMIGRAAVANPALFRVLQGGNQLTLRELREFHDRLTEAWLEAGLSPVFTVERMKTLWSYMQAMFPENRREVKTILKSRTMDSFRSAVGTLLSAGAFQPGAVS
jgi:tRNA-dihydrouridine synthase